MFSIYFKKFHYLLLLFGFQGCSTVSKFQFSFKLQNLLHRFLALYMSVRGSVTNVTSLGRGRKRLHRRRRNHATSPTSIMTNSHSLLCLVLVPVTFFKALPVPLHHRLGEDHQAAGTQRVLLETPVEPSLDCSGSVLTKSSDGFLQVASYCWVPAPRWPPLAP